MQMLHLSTMTHKFSGRMPSLDATPERRQNPSHGGPKITQLIDKPITGKRMLMHRAIFFITQANHVSSAVRPP